ncbi:MAG: MarR family transcriptional regulator [Lachnospiraceae bacterium]|jgi:DNA-binding MarR family transcriptional regulator|nr:MarR family transcriptional regulator [Lachnospiraceae bacterium]
MDEERREKLMNLSDMVDNLYKRGRQSRSMENSPRYYGSDILLYPNEVYTLKAIAQNEGINQTELTKVMFRTKGATSVVVRKLVNKKLVEQRAGEEDLRISRLYPTKKGLEVYRAHLEYDLKYLDQLADRLNISLDDLITANRVLRILIRSFDERKEEENHREQ